MKCDKRFKILLSGYIDGELSPDEKTELENHLKECAECRGELESFRTLKEVTGAMKYADVPNHVWENYWGNLYRRLELGFGWIFFSIGAIIILAFGGFYLIKDFFFSPEPPLVLRIGIGIGLFGVIILLVSALRERVFAYNRDRYREVDK